MKFGRSPRLLASLLGSGRFSSHPQHPASVYLQDDGCARLELQDSRGTKGLKHGVGIVGEIGLVEDEQGLDVVQDEAKLLGPLCQVRLVVGPQRKGRSLAGHLRGVQNLTELQRSRQGDSAGGLHWRARLPAPTGPPVMLPCSMGLIQRVMPESESFAAWDTQPRHSGNIFCSWHLTPRCPWQVWQ